MSGIGQDATSSKGGPRAPNITKKDILRQFWADLYGKEVQSASTYSYTWMADQMGHICLGIIINFGLTLVARYVVLPCFNIDPAAGPTTAWGMPASWDAIAGFVLGSIVVSIWELSAFLSSAKAATGLFPLDRKLLRDNAIIAAAYMVIGVGVGFAFHQPALWGLAEFMLLMLVAVVCAPPWLCQKIIWQKAALPYLFRLADAQRTIGVEAAQQLQALIDKGAPPTTPPYQVIVGGPIGSGRTPIAAGIGTEFAFKKTTVRYLSLDALLEFAAQPATPAFADDTGPPNINYWPWSEAQVVIIDDIGPLIAAREQDQEANLEQFRKLLSVELSSIAPVFAKCHTVWVLGDLRPEGQTTIAGEVLNRFAKAIGDFCKTQNDILVVELSQVHKVAAEDKLKPTADAAVASPARVRTVEH